MSLDRSRKRKMHLNLSVAPKYMQRKILRLNKSSSLRILTYKLTPAILYINLLMIPKSLTFLGWIILNFRLASPMHTTMELVRPPDGSRNTLNQNRQITRVIMQRTALSLDKAYRYATLKLNACLIPVTLPKRIFTSGETRNRKQKILVSSKTSTSCNKVPHGRYPPAYI